LSRIRFYGIPTIDGNTNTKSCDPELYSQIGMSFWYEWWTTLFSQMVQRWIWILSLCPAVSFPIHLTQKSMKFHFLYSFFLFYFNRDHPPAQVFELNGINVDVSLSIFFYLNICRCLMLFCNIKTNIWFKVLMDTNGNLMSHWFSCIIQRTRKLYLKMLISHHPDDIAVKYQQKLHHFRQFLIMVTWLSSVSLSII
jgi:hypothetical protein